MIRIHKKITAVCIEVYFFVVPVFRVIEMRWCVCERENEREREREGERERLSFIDQV